MNTPGERMKFWIEKIVEVSVVQFADYINVEPKSVYNIINNRNKTIIGKGTKALIFDRFPNFPWLWIKDGGDTPDKDTATMVEHSTKNCPECRIKDMEIAALKEEIAGLKGLLEASDANQSRLEKMIVNYENLYNETRNELERYRKI
jgi:hypothetical protein